jgi:hypothetical protein
MAHLNMSAIFGLLAGFEAIWSLLLIGALLGLGALWTFGWFSNQQAIRGTKNRLKASLLEMRLFGDEPTLVFRALRDLLAGNVRLLALTLKPLLLLCLPLLLLISFLDPFYGRIQLPVGQPAILTVHLRQRLNPGTPPPRLETPAAVAVETPAVRSMTDREISWRIRPEQAVDGTVRVIFPGEVLEKHIAAGNGRGFASDRRASSLSGWLMYPGEARLVSSSVDWISLRYPPANVSWLGLEFHWLVWLMIASLAATLVFKRRMGVA